MNGIGIVGLGFMGMIHYHAWSRVDGARVVAVSSRDARKRAGDWTTIQGNFGPRGTQTDLSGIACYADYDAILNDPSVDIIDLCVPNDRHAEMAIQALRAGKNVIVEKPIATSLAEADAMRAEARSSGKQLLVAQVLPFFPEFAFIRRAIASGDFEKVKAAHFHRLISRPNWSSAIADASRTGGPVIDLHIHDVHFIALAFGTPRAVFSRGVIEAGAVAYVSTEYLFDTPGPVVSCLSGALSAAGRPFVHGFEVFFENATLSFESANMGSAGTVVRPLAVIRADGTVEKPALGSDDPIEAFAAMLSSAIQSIETDEGAEGSPLAADLARQALSLCLAEIQSVECGAIVPID